MSEESKASGIFSKVVSFVKEAKFLDPVRSVLFKSGGRKLATTGGAFLVIDRIVTVGGANFSWPHGIACLSVALVSAAFVFANAHEDGKKNENAKPDA